jgi:hypothetical protein
MESIIGFPPNFKPADGFATAEHLMTTVEVAQMIIDNSGIATDVATIYKFMTHQGYIQKTLETKLVWLIAAE